MAAMVPTGRKACQDRKMRIFSILLLLPLISGQAVADVVKPALVEISVYRDGRVGVELRASIEALITGINGRWRNTQDAPQAEEYDALRVLGPEALQRHFQAFFPTLLQGIRLGFDGRPVDLSIADTHIPPAGYTKVPRISLIHLRGQAPTFADSLTWYYPLRFGDNAVRVRQVDQATQRWHWSPYQWIRKDQPSQPFSLKVIYAQRAWHEVMFGYVVIGFEHILPRGVDHILFILGIFLLGTRMRPLLWQVTMFTLAHTLTLGLSMAGYVALPARVVEPLIALSIAYIGLENIYATRGGYSGNGLSRFRLPLVFGFGLLHGLGFADALRAFGMPTQDFLSALIAFNVGVELGQLVVISAAFVFVGLGFGNRPWYRNRIIVPGSLLIGFMGVYWAVERI